MVLTSFGFRNFRNIETMVLEPCENINVIYGENAQGKTNILEGIWLFTGCKSFRTSKDSEMIMLGEEEAKLKVNFFSENRYQYMNIDLGTKRIASKNGIFYPSTSKMIGEIRCVVFSPTHLNIIKGGPAERRKFLDIAISQIKPGYAKDLIDYNRALKQRNATLKEAHFNVSLLRDKDIWNEAIAEYGIKVIKQRLEFLEKFNKEVKEIYKGISSDREEFDLCYLQAGAVGNFSTKIKYLEVLNKYTPYDVADCITSVGPHRDDIFLAVDEISVRKFGSQGQQRSVALAMKLAEANMIEKYTGDKPIILLDDVMSELDESRQDYILNHIKDRQVFITCCDPNTIKNFKEGKSFEIEDGVIINQG